MSNVYVISLLRNIDRRNAIAEEMNDKGIEFVFFDAIDGRGDINRFTQDYDYKKCLWLTSGKMPLVGEIGCYASHYLLWVKCISENKPIIIIEDDVVPCENASEVINIALEKVEKYGILRLEQGYDLKTEKEIENADGIKINLMRNNALGARAYAISPNAALRLIKHRWCFPVDCFIGANYIHGQYSYVLSPFFVAKHNMFESSIQESAVKTAAYRKPSRELYTLYKKIMISIMHYRGKKIKHC